MQLGAIIWQARGPIFQLLLIYLIICTVPLGLGTYLLVAPGRAGNFLNNAFAIFPHVQEGDWVKKLVYGALGVALIAISAFYSRGIFANIVSPVLRYLRHTG